MKTSMNTAKESSLITSKIRRKPLHIKRKNARLISPNFNAFNRYQETDETRNNNPAKPVMTISRNK